MPVRTRQEHQGGSSTGTTPESAGAGRNGVQPNGRRDPSTDVSPSGVAAATEPRHRGGTVPQRTALPSWWRSVGPAGSIGLVALYVFTLAAVAGYAVFGVNPGRLLHLPAWAASFYATSFGFFAQGHVWLAMAVLVAVLLRHAGTRWLVPFAAMYGLSLGSELAGTTWGIPFGAYGYTALLGPMWLERVPVVIPLSWFFMAVPAYALAGRLSRGPAGRILAGSFVLLAWDLALDPAMSYATRYWNWGETGPYYGMPWLNLFGWYATGVALMAVLVWRRAGEWTSRISDGWWAAFYGANMALPLGMCAAAGLWGAVAVTGAVLALLYAADRLLAAHRAAEAAA
jgi:uncharacterized membrane protein